MKRIIFIVVMFCVALQFGENIATAASDEVGTIVALRGTARISRGQTSLDAKVKNPIKLQDSITTGEGSRAKLLFIDDSVLTLADKSRLVIKDFVHSKENKGQSIFNLLDGKMRAVVGKTKFEVQTPTAVAAARGTVIFFEVGEMAGHTFTRIVCLEGTVDVRGVGITGNILLTPGMTITIVQGEPLPTPTTLSPQELDKLKQGTTTSGNEISVPEPNIIVTDTGLLNIEIPPSGTPIQVQQQPPVTQPRSAIININVR